MTCSLTAKNHGLAKGAILTFLATISALCLLMSGSVHAQDALSACKISVDNVRLAIREDKLETIRKSFELVSSSCPGALYPSVAFCTGRSIALAHYEKAVAMSKDNASQGKIIAVINAGLRYGKPWQLLYARGEIDQSISRFSAAALGFSAAIDDFAEPITCIDEETVIQEMFLDERRKLAHAMFHNAEYNLLRAKWLPPEIKYRCCQPSGVLRHDIRGFIPDERNFRIDFVFRRSRLARNGEEGLRRLEQYIAQRKLAPVNLEVHTESLEGAGVPCRVARDRAARIGGYLTALHPDWKLNILAIGDAEKYNTTNGEIKRARHLPRIVLRETTANLRSRECPL